MSAFGRQGSASEAAIATVAEQYGLTKRAIRYYEQRGLILTMRDAANRRIYDAEARARLQLISQMKAAGLSLAEFMPILALEPQGRPAQLRAIAGALRVKLAALDETRDRMAAALSAIEQELAPQAKAAGGR